MEKLSINGKASKALAISDGLTKGNGFPIWLVSALIIDFSFNRFTPPTSIFSTAKSGVKIVARTSSSRAPNDETEINSIVFRWRDFAVNRLASGDNLEKKVDLRLLFLIRSSFFCSRLLSTGLFNL